MRIGFDVDGILADFSQAFMRAIIAASGRDLFHPEDWDNPPCWDWDKFRGYAPSEREAAWETVRQSPDFWFNLGPLDTNVSALARAFEPIDDDHEVYFITQREGVQVRKQTEDWLIYNLGLMKVPTVLIVGHRVKGVVAKALKLNAYVDDNYDNCVDCVRESPTTRTYLLDRSYNRGENSQRVHDVEARRVFTLEGFLHAESLLPYTEGVVSLM